MEDESEREKKGIRDGEIGQRETIVKRKGRQKRQSGRGVRGKG